MTYTISASLIKQINQKLLRQDRSFYSKIKRIQPCKLKQIFWRTLQFLQHFGMLTQGYLKKIFFRYPLLTRKYNLDGLLLYSVRKRTLQGTLTLSYNFAAILSLSKSKNWNKKQHMSCGFDSWRWFLLLLLLLFSLASTIFVLLIYCCGFCHYRAHYRGTRH